MRFQFTIAALLAITTLTAVVLGVSIAAPGLGIALAIVAVPALVRTMITGMQEGWLEKRLPVGEKIGHFVGWLCVGLLALVGGAIVAVLTVVVGFFLSCVGGVNVNGPVWSLFAPQNTGIATAVVLMLILCWKIKF
jgi:hypothetical protein